MKKIVGIIAAAALAASAFAEINIGNWNRGVFVPVFYDGDTLRSLEGPSWGVEDKGGIRTGLSFSGSTENAGFAMDIHGNPGAEIAIGDNAYAFVKPVDMLTVKFGKMDNNWGRLDHCFGTWDYWRFGNGMSTGEGLAGVVRQNGLGAEVTLQPVEGLVIDYEANFGGKGENRTYQVMWENSSTMVGYQAGFGFIRAIVNGQKAGFYSKKDSDTAPAATIALAADITAVENLTLKLGFSMPTILKTKDSAIRFGVGADYNLDALALHANVDAGLLPKSVNDDGDHDLGAFGANISAGVDYTFTDAWKLVTDVRFKTYTNVTKDGKDLKYEDPAFGGYIGLQQSLSNASFAFGAMFGKRSMAKNDDFTFAVPLTITASF